MKRLKIATVDPNYQSELLNTNATDLATQIMGQFTGNKDVLQDIMFNNGQNTMQTIDTNYVQNLANTYTGENPNYDANALTADTTSLIKAVYNNIVNKIEAMTFHEVEQAFGVTINQQ